MRRFTGFVCAALIAACGASAHAAEKSSKKDSFTFGTIQAPSEVQVRVEAANWLKEAGQYDAKRTEFNAIWNNKDKSILDKVAETFALGDKEADKILAEARNATASAPTSLPEVLNSTKKTTFYRANLALAYAKTLINRKVYEEGLETLKLFKVEQVVDPASYLFFKAVAEHGLMDRKSANDTITRLLDDLPAAPERYKMVAALMHFDMISWNPPKSQNLEEIVRHKLGDVGRKMNNVQRRLALERGGKKTQKEQKQIVKDLDELIKELENANNSDSNSSCPNGGNCPSGGQAKQPSNGKPGQNIQASAPQQDSNGGDGGGKGEIDVKRLQEKLEVWGKLPAREREEIMIKATATMDPRYREIIMEYFKRQSMQEGSK